MEKKKRKARGRGVGGRPSTSQHPSVAVTHLDTGASVAWSDGEFAGDQDLVMWTRIAVDAQAPVRLGPRGHTVTAAGDSPLGAVAAMLDACGGRGVVDFPADPADIPGWPQDNGCIPDTRGTD